MKNAAVKLKRVFSFRERGPRSGPREPLTSAREGRLDVFRFEKVPKIWPELAT